MYTPSKTKYDSSIKNIPMWLKLLTSIFSAALLFSHLDKCITIDWISIVLLGFILIPWYLYYVKGFKLPGGTEILLQDTTDKPVPPSESSNPESFDLSSSPQSLKILKTLWKHQKQYFQDDFSKRWMFIVTPQATVYGDFLTGLVQLFKAGYVAINPEHYCMLTNEGISYCKENEESIMNYPDIYRF